MKQKVNLSVCGVEITHTHSKFFLKLLLLCCMYLGLAQEANAQHVVVTATKTNATTNDLLTFQALFYDDNSGCTSNGNVSWSLGSGATIISGAGTAQITVRYTTPGNYQVNADVSVTCQGGWSYGVGSGLNLTIIQAPVTISGRVTNNCGIGVGGVTITFTGIGNFGGTNFSATTSSSGFYSITVPYSYSSTISASKPNYQFSASQNYTNTTADRTLNFSVVNLSGFQISISDWAEGNNNITIGGLTVGFDYILSYTDSNNVTSSLEFNAHSNSMVFDLNMSRYARVCVTPKCGSQISSCRQF